MSAIPGIVWPPLASVATAPLPALMQQLARLERASSNELAAGQEAQLQVLGAWFASHAPAYQRRLLAAEIDPAQALTFNVLHKLPPLTRRDLQAVGNALFCTPPAAHLPHAETRTSGSSGEPVVVRRSAINQLFWLACSLREHLWWQRDFSGTLASIRANLGPEPIRRNNWGPPASLIATTGPGHACSMATDTASQARWLSAIDPHYLLTYPNNLADLLRHVEQTRLAWPRLRQIRSIGETLSDALRDDTRRLLGVDIVDTYSSQEAGVIAIQCPAGQYHLMAENLIVEVLNTRGQPCQPGETGAVVVSDLHNFATPLLRYAIGDHAEVGEACACGRTLPTLRRILGRSRNMAVYPDGTRRWPRVGFDRYREAAPVVQYQLLQHAVDAIEVRLVVERPLLPAEEAALGDVIRNAMGYPFALSYTYFAERIPRSPSGKFEEFVCMISP